MTNHTESTPTVQVGAYFYPHTRRSDALSLRALEVSEAIESPLVEPASDLELAQAAQPLFEGHDQPHTYCIAPGGETSTEWDDSDADALIAQIALAGVYGLSYFIFDSYTGVRNGRVVREITEPLRIASLTHHLGMLGFKYARMEALESPRVILPIPRDPLGTTKFYTEPDRQYDLTPATAHAIVEDCGEDWSSEHYLRIDGYRPYLSFLAPTFPEQTSRKEKIHTIRTLVQALRDHAYEMYALDPYLVGVMRSPSDVELLAGSGVDAITQYCHLPEFGDGSPSVQGYAELAKRRREDWHSLHAVAAERRVPFIPTPPVGWDASPRGEPGHTLAEVEGLHPYTPIVTNNTPNEVAQTLEAAIDFTEQHVPENQRLVTMFAWNEVGEGAALLPQLRPDGAMDKSYLEAVRNVIRTRAKTSPMMG